jgi:uncharacterized protein YdeI (YjbR/CyaY-like superfamily)
MQDQRYRPLGGRSADSSPLKPDGAMGSMTISRLLHAETRAEWREWLIGNYQSAHDIWLVTCKKASGRPSVPYNDAVEEALCFGWIDSIRKSLDDDSSAQRYSPRRRGSGFSQPNLERIARMREQGLVMPDVLPEVAHLRPEDYVVPDDILTALAAEPEALAFFRSTSPSYQRIRAAYVDGRRDDPEDFARRLANLVDKCRRRKQFGFGIESYY